MSPLFRRIVLSVAPVAFALVCASFALSSHRAYASCGDYLMVGHGTVAVGDSPEVAGSPVAASHRGPMRLPCQGGRCGGVPKGLPPSPVIVAIAPHDQAIAPKWGRNAAPAHAIGFRRPSSDQPPAGFFVDELLRPPQVS